MASKKTVNADTILKNDISFTYVPPKPKEKNNSKFVTVSMKIGNETHQIIPNIRVPCTVAFAPSKITNPALLKKIGTKYTLQFAQSTSAKLLAVIEKIQTAIYPVLKEQVDAKTIAVTAKVADKLEYVNKIKKVYGDQCLDPEKIGKPVKDPYVVMEVPSPYNPDAEAGKTPTEFSWVLLDKEKKMVDRSDGKEKNIPYLNDLGKVITPKNFFDKENGLQAGTVFDPAIIMFYVSDSPSGISLKWKIKQGLVIRSKGKSGSTDELFDDSYEPEVKVDAKVVDAPAPSVTTTTTTSKTPLDSFTESLENELEETEEDIESGEDSDLEPNQATAVVTNIKKKEAPPPKKPAPKPAPVKKGKKPVKKTVEEDEIEDDE